MRYRGNESVCRKVGGWDMLLSWWVWQKAGMSTEHHLAIRNHLPPIARNRLRMRIWIWLQTEKFLLEAERKQQECLPRKTFSPRLHRIHVGHREVSQNDQRLYHGPWTVLQIWNCRHETKREKRRVGQVGIWDTVKYRSRSPHRCLHHNRQPGGHFQWSNRHERLHCQWAIQM